VYLLGSRERRETQQREKLPLEEGGKGLGRKHCELTLRRNSPAASARHLKGRRTPLSEGEYALRSCSRAVRRLLISISKPRLTILEQRWARFSGDDNDGHVCVDIADLGPHGGGARKVCRTPSTYLQRKNSQPLESDDHGCS